MLEGEGELYLAMMSDEVSLRCKVSFTPDYTFHLSTVFVTVREVPFLHMGSLGGGGVEVPFLHRGS